MKPLILLGGLFMASLALLTACIAAPVVADDRCGAVALAGYVGQPVAAMPADHRPVATRIIRPGDAVTEDFSESRLNVYLDAGDVITTLTCG